MSKLSRLLAILLLSAALGAPAVADAASGDLDPAFGTGGRVLTDFGRNEGATSVAVDRQGRILVGGSVTDGTPTQGDSTPFDVARYLPDGALDTTFGEDGRAQVGFGGSLAILRTVEVDAEGRILLTGSSFNLAAGMGTFAMSRLLPDGSLDPSFGDGGRVLTKLGMSGANEASIDVEGRIVVVGASQNHSGILSTVLRYLPDGTLDPRFSHDGVRRIRIGTFAAFRSLAVEPSGAVALLGDLKSRRGGRSRLTVKGLREDGANDRNFGRRGRVRLLRGASARSGDVEAGPGGDLIVAATCRCTAARRSRHLVVAQRLHPSGGIDASFGDGGLARIDFGGSAAQANDVAVDSNGRIVIGADASSSILGGWGIARLTPEGRLDKSFSGDGTTSTEADIAAGPGGAADVAVGPADAILAVGTGVGPDDKDFEVRRYLP